MTTNITEFSKRVQPHVAGCPKFLVDAAVVDAIIKLCEETHVYEKAFEHDVLSTDVNTADNDSVNVNIATYLTNVRPLAVVEFKIDGTTWNTAKVDLLNVQDDISEIAVIGAKLFTYPDVTHIKFYDIEAEGQRFYIKQAYAPIPGITTIDDLFYYEHLRAVVGGALDDLLSQPGKDWSNPLLAQKYRADFNDGKAMAIIRKDKTVGSRRPRSMRFF